MMKRFRGQSTVIALMGILVLLFSIACTTTEEVIKEVEVEKIVEKEVVKEVEVEVEKEVVKEVIKEVSVEKIVEVAAAATYPDEMTLAVGAIPVTLVGNTIPSLQSRLFSRLVYGQLAALNDDSGQVEPELLESMALLDDTTIRIVLKKDIVFHNGEKLDAPGLKKSFDLLSASQPEKFTWKFTGFKDYEDTGTVVDDYTMEFKLKAPVDRWASAFTFMPLAPAHLEKVGLDGYIDDPVGTGPYKFVEWQRDSFIKLTRWDDYPGPLPVIKNVTVRHVPEAAVRVAGLQSGEFDVIAATPPELVPSLIKDGFQIFVGDSMQSMYIGLNVYGTNKSLSNKKVRQAMLYALDMDAMWETIAGGYGSRLQCQIVAEGGFGYNPALVGRYDYDPDRARELLVQAGYPNGVTVTGSATTARYFRDRALLDAIAAQWTQVGINVDMSYPESGEWLQLLINGTLPDGFMNIGLNWYLSDNTTSMWGAAADPKFVEMRDAKSLITDPVAREKAVLEISEYICDEAQAIHAYTIPNVFAISPDMPLITASKSFELRIPSE
ncbi:MAG: ABC transporter substrate-binding protein [SAR202 cluster bacterium]|jgi:peptide/nickel transport system substrate-binding protein|nr:ABC transporter substrate-binding protein [SAR202 cluster bacterium]